jgi:hypothetical protein
MLRRNAAWMGAALILAAALAWLQFKPASRVIAVESASPGAAVHPARRATSAVAIAPEENPLPDDAPFPAVLPGHEGHGDECAECFGQRKLASYREDYARLQLSLVTADAPPLDPAETRRLLAACRQLAASVLLRWSFSDSRPVLAADDVVEAKRREILGEFLIHRQADDSR